MEKLETKHRKLSMMDVAKLAGVSKTTVSYVLNNNPRVSKETVMRVSKACEAIGYRMNTSIQDLARETISGATRNIALVLVEKEFADPTYARLIDGIAEGTAENNYHMLFAKLRGDETGVMDMPPILRDRRVDGVLLSGNLNEGVLECLRKLEIPGVILGNHSRSITKYFPVVESNIPAGIHDVIEQFAKRNRKRIAFFNESTAEYSDKQHLSGFMDALSEYGLTAYDDIIYSGGDASAGALSTLTPIFKQEHLPFDAIYCPNYRSAVEISQLVVARTWSGIETDVILATIRAFSYHKLTVPAIYMDVLTKELACKGVYYLLEHLSNDKENFSSSLLLSPIVDTSALPY